MLSKKKQTKNIPGESIRPADPVVFDRIPFSRIPTRISSELDQIRVGFQSCSVEFRQNPGRYPTKTLSDPIEIFSIRRDPIPPQSHGISTKYVFFLYI
jgi:hypothetical protein